MADVARVDIDESPDPIAWAELTSQPDLAGALWGLYYAIYYGSADDIKALPTSVLKAYGRVQEAFGG